MADVIRFPGVGSVPAPGPRAVPADLDALGDRYVEYCEARDTGQERKADLLARAVADDTPAWQAEVARVEALRLELAAELDRIRGELDRLQGGPGGSASPTTTRDGEQ